MKKQYAGLFRSMTDEAKFLRRYDSLADQVGLDNILVCLPRHWAKDFADYNGRVKLEFTTLSEITIIATCGIVRIEETASLFEVAFKRRYRVHRKAV